MKKNKFDRVIITIISIGIPLILACLLIRRLDNLNYNYADFNGIEIVKTLLGVWSTLLGFMITAVSILLSVNENNYIVAFRSSGHYHTIIYAHGLTCLILFSATVFSTIIMCLNIWNRICFFVFIMLIFSTFIALALSIFFLFFIIFKSN